MARLPSRHRPPASTVIPLPRDVMPALRAAGSHGIARRAAGSSVTSQFVRHAPRRPDGDRRQRVACHPGAGRHRQRTCRRGCARSAGRGAGRSAGAGSCGASRRCAGGTRAATASRWCRPPGAAGASRSVWRPCYAGARQPEPASSSAAGGRRDSRAEHAGLGRCSRTTATAAVSPHVRSVRGVCVLVTAAALGPASGRRTGAGSRARTASERSS